MTSPSTRPTLTPLLLVLLALLSSFTPLSIDMYLPALPVIAVDLHGTTGDIQLTLSAFMIAFGAGQIFYGPAGDRFGRRPVILSGVAQGSNVRVSGLIPAEHNNEDKSLNGQTDIACEAGVQAVIDGDIVGNELDAQRIENLEAAAARFVATTDFTDPLSVTASANQVRVLTDNGEHPAP